MSDSVLLSTAYLPPLSWMGNFLGNETCYIEIWENYKKQTYRNRCNIYSANGILPLIIPVIKTTGNHTLIKDIRIDNNRNWQLNHWKSIEAAYNKTPFFIHYSESIRNIIFSRTDFLIDLNNKLLTAIIGNLRAAEKKIQFTDSYSHAFINDLRDTIHPKKTDFSKTKLPEYYQPFSHKCGFQADLSIIDLLFNKGPDSLEYLSRLRSL